MLCDGLLLGMIVGRFGVPDATDPFPRENKTVMMIVTRLTDGVVPLLACPPAAARLSKEVAVVGRPSQGKTRLKIKPT